MSSFEYKQAPAIPKTSAPARSNGFEEASVAALQIALAEIPDIDAFHVVGNGKVEEVHVVTSSGKNPKQLVRDIESVLAAKHHISVDRKKISIAQLSERVGVSVPVFRPLITSIAGQVSGTASRVEVRLAVNEDEYLGEATGTTSKSWTRRLVASATLDALVKASKQSVAFALEDVTIVTLSRERIALVGLSIIAQGPEQLYCGTAVVRHDEKDAIARATLDAVNRRLGFLTTS